MKRNQRGDVGATMLIMMLLMIVGFGWWAGKDGGMHMTSGPSAQEHTKSAIELLDEAYARGEITREEYLQKRNDLTRGE